MSTFDAGIGQIRGELNSYADTMLRNPHSQAPLATVLEKLRSAAAWVQLIRPMIGSTVSGGA